MDLQQSHIVSLSAQSNVYSSCLLEWPPSYHHLLAASLNGSILCLDYQLVSGQLRPTTTNIQFMYLPADAEIVSIDCYCQPSRKRPVVGITLVKPGQGGESRAHFLNIYGARLDYSAVDTGDQNSLTQLWRSIGEDWQTCDLSFTPFKLGHVALDDNEDDTAFLLAGSDCRVHLYRCSPVLLTFKEDDPVTVQSMFPEFSNPFPACVTSLDIQKQDSYRLVAIGMQTGDMQLILTDLSKAQPAVLKTWHSSCLEGPVTSLRLLMPVTSTSMASRDCGYSLVATCAVEMAAVFHHVKLCGFSLGAALAESSKYDSVLCTCVADLDGDGSNEIIIGTYGHMLLIYKQSSLASSDSSDFQLVFQQRLAQPIYALFCCDIVGDGLKELVVVTLKAVVVFQQNLAVAADRCVERLKLWKEAEDLRRAISSHGHTPVA